MSNPEIPLHLVETRLKLNDPTNPGMGPTRYINTHSFEKPDPEETKERIRIKTEKLAAQLRAQSVATKKRLDDEFRLKCRELIAYNSMVKKKGALRQEGCLKVGCGQRPLTRYFSPYHADLVRVVEDTRHTRDKRERRKKQVHKYKYDLREMTGTPKFSLATPELAEVIDKHIVPHKRMIGASGDYKLPSTDKKLAVGRLLTVQDANVHIREIKSISSMQDKELELVEKTFPIVAIEMEASRSKGLSFNRSCSPPGGSLYSLKSRPRTNSDGLRTSWRTSLDFASSHGSEFGRLPTGVSFPFAGTEPESDRRRDGHSLDGSSVRILGGELDRDSITGDPYGSNTATATADSLTKEIIGIAARRATAAAAADGT